jgi:hypothetical protein
MIRIGEASEVDKVDLSAELFGNGVANSYRDGRLADATGAQQGHEPLFLKAAHDLAEHRVQSFCAGARAGHPGIADEHFSLRSRRVGQRSRRTSSPVPLCLRCSGCRNGHHQALCGSRPRALGDSPPPRLRLARHDRLAPALRSPYLDARQDRSGCRGPCRQGAAPRPRAGAVFLQSRVRKGRNSAF